MVAASVSGVYRCVASNSAGTDQLDHHFYVTGDPVIEVFFKESQHLFKMSCILFKLKNNISRH